MFKISEYDEDFGLFSGKEKVQIYKKSLLNHGFEDENLVGVFYFIKFIDDDKNYKYWRIVSTLLLAENGTQDIGFKKYFLKEGFILECVDEPKSVYLKMEDGKILGYYDDVGREEMNESVLRGKLKIIKILKNII